MKFIIKVLISCVLIISIGYSQTIEYDRVQLLKSSDKAEDGKITGVWSYSLVNGELQPQYNFYTNDDNKQLVIFPAGPIDTIEFINPVLGKMYIIFKNPSAKHILDYFIEFEHELVRLTKEIKSAEINNKLINFNHQPSFIPELEAKFKILISKSNNRPRMIQDLNEYKYMWYEDYLKNQRINAELIFPFPKFFGARFDEQARKTIMDGNSTYTLRQYFSYDYLIKQPYMDAYFRNDTLVEKREYDPKDTLTYMVKTFYPNLMPTSEGRVVKGMKEGVWKYYDEKGKLIRKEKYQKDILKSGKK